MLLVLNRLRIRALQAISRAGSRTAEVGCEPSKPSETKTESALESPCTTVMMPLSAFTRSSDATGPGGFFFLQRVVL